MVLVITERLLINTIGCQQFEKTVKEIIRAINDSLHVFLSVCLYPINVQTAYKQIGPFSFVATHMTSGKVYRCSKYEKAAFKYFDFRKIL